MSFRSASFVALSATDDTEEMLECDDSIRVIAKLARIVEQEELYGKSVGIK